jgi:hypothetical protein
MATLESRVESLEQEVRDLKKQLTAKAAGRVQISLKGALKATRFSEREIRDAKRSLFPSSRAK